MTTSLIPNAANLKNFKLSTQHENVCTCMNNDDMLICNRT
jgi:hypothetical protein